MTSNDRPERIPCVGRVAPKGYAEGDNNFLLRSLTRDESALKYQGE